MLVAAPVMANAATKLTPAQITQPSQTIATTTYVQGAYNTLVTPINDIIDETTVPAAAEGQSYKAIATNKNVAENLVALDAAIKAAETSSGNTYVTLDSAVTTAPGENGTLHYLNGTTAGTNVGTNLGILDNQVYTNAQNISANANAIGTIGNLAAGSGAIASGTTDLVTAVNAINSSLSQSNVVSGGNYVTNGDTVVQAIGELDSAVKGNADKIGNVATMGTTANTVAGAVAEMHGQQIDIVTTWGQEANPTQIYLFPQKQSGSGT